MGSLESGKQRSREWEDHQGNQMNWDPTLTLNNLLVLEEKIHHLRELVPLIDAHRNQVTGKGDALFLQQQDLINAGLTSIIVQLISTAGGLLPFVKQQLGLLFGNIINQSVAPLGNINNSIPIRSGAAIVDEHGTRSEDDPEEGENLPPGSYEIIQLEKEELLAPHTHFCSICGKGFKRDANLRMHMRGHGDEYKTTAALLKPPLPPNTSSSLYQGLVRRFSCPYVGCKRNKDHKKFQPLKTILCVKNHYKRTHCDKTYTCSRCNVKKFSVLADLKTHEKHCGRDKWLCSCGTTFARKDKLFGHISLFQGHSPAIPVEDSRTSTAPSDQGQCSEAMINNAELTVDDQTLNAVQVEGCLEDPSSYFLPLGFETGGIEGFDEFSQASSFNDSDKVFPFML